jgi:predicted phosphodiesterase
MTAYRFVHLSDIHFGQEQNGTLVIHDDVREELLRDCEDQRARLGKADAILVTGDTAFSGKEDEYRRAGEWLDRLARAVGCSKVAVSVIPGNHDVDHDQIDMVAEIVHDKLRKASSDELDGILDRIAKGNEQGNTLFSKFSAYRRFAAQYGCDFESVARPIWKKDYPLGALTIKFVGLNSVQVSDKEDTLGKMVLGNSQYIIPREDNVEYVVMLHHPLSWLKDRVCAEKYLRRARVLMMGHEHHQEIRKTIREDGLEYLEVYAGATNPTKSDNFYNYSYNWIEFEFSPENGKNKLNVKVYARIWEPTKTSFVPDKTRFGGEISKVFSVMCPNFSAVVAVKHSEDISEVPAPVGNLTAGRPEMAENESEQFARLRYFFWRYLDWHQRLKVLVELDILPSTMNQPLPQTMERLALNKAQSQGKLYDLWTAVMEMVPEDKRETNPFTKERG